MTEPIFSNDPHDIEEQLFYFYDESWLTGLGRLMESKEKADVLANGRIALAASLRRSVSASLLHQDSNK